MTPGLYDRISPSRSANTFPCQRNPLDRRYFPILTVEDEFDSLVGFGVVTCSAARAIPDQPTVTATVADIR